MLQLSVGQPGPTGSTCSFHDATCLVCEWPQAIPLLTQNVISTVSILLALLPNSYSVAEKRTPQNSKYCGPCNSRLNDPSHSPSHVRSTPGNDNITQVFPKPNGGSCTLSSLPNMTPNASRRCHLHIMLQNLQYLPCHLPGS